MAERQEDLMARNDRPNVDPAVVAGFGDEWRRFDQTGLTAEDHAAMFDSYFHIFPWEVLPPNAVGFDLGCGSGRWARLVAPRVGTLHCIDPSPEALDVARRTCASLKNCAFHLASVDEMPLPPESADFGYSLGVLHHLPDPQKGIEACVSRLRRGAPFLVYLYYGIENRPRWFAGLYRVSELFRHVISRLPKGLRYAVSQVLAVLVYWPLARLARVAETLGLPHGNLPLHYYRSRGFYVMRTDALDRFSTRVQKRFTRDQIEAMLLAAGLRDVVFSESAPFWCAVGFRR